MVGRYEETFLKKPQISLYGSQTIEGQAVARTMYGTSDVYIRWVRETPVPSMLYGYLYRSNIPHAPYR